MRTSWPTWLLAGAVSLALLVAGSSPPPPGQSGDGRPEPGTGEGLPSSVDLRHALLGLEHQLEALELPPGTELVPGPGWGLTSLTLTRSETRVLLRLPPLLERLDLRGARISTISQLPASLRCLDIRFAEGLEELPTLPPRLERLGLSGRLLLDLPEIPSRLRGLAIEDPTDEAFQRLPPDLDLHELALTGGRLERLDALPADLRTLTIAGTHIPKLTRLPDRLQHLEIRGSSLRSITLLPRNLTRLEMDNWTSGSLDDWPPFLQDLTAIRSRWPPERVPLLTRLDIGSSPAEVLAGFRWLRFLKIRGRVSRGPSSPESPTLDLSRLPELEGLELAAPEDVTWSRKIPLRHLAISGAYTGDPDLAGLEELRSLGLVLRKPGIRVWPPALRKLEITFLEAPAEPAGLLELLPGDQPLPPHLEDLTLIGPPGRELHLPAGMALPESLTRLILVGVDPSGWLGRLPVLRRLRIVQIDEPTPAFLEALPPSVRRLVLRGLDDGPESRFCEP